ncbi:MAG: DUF63 family protein [Candidatus Aenigmatarchaeota archaeon]
MDWLNEYFIQPILQNGWFNPVNTLAYSIGLILGILLVYRLLTRMKVQIDYRFFLALLPFIFWGSTTRVLRDAAFAGALPSDLAAFYSSAIFPTPGSYLITFGLALAVLVASLLIQRFQKIPYWKTMLTIGLALCALNVSMLPFVTLLPGILIVAIALFWSDLFFLPRLTYLQVLKSRKEPKNMLFSQVNLGILSAHFLDASATYFSLSLFGYLEQHVLPRFIIFDLGAGPISMFALKIAVVLPVLFLIDRYAGDRNFKNLLKIAVLILGLAPGIRDTVRVMVRV